MKQAQLVNSLRAYVRAGRSEMKGQDAFATFLAAYIEGLNIPMDRDYFWKIENYISQILLGAIHTLLTSDEELAATCREWYKGETGHSFPDPTKICSGSGLNEGHALRMIKFLMVDVTGLEYLRYTIDALLNAERHFVSMGFCRFLDQIYIHGGLRQIIMNAGQGMSGIFGKTTLCSRFMGGNLLFTFARGSGEDEKSISFACNNEDPLGLGAGLQSCYVPPQVALEMFNDVIAGWNEGKANYVVDPAAPFRE